MIQPATAVHGLGTYIGFVSYDIYELRIYGNGYELWNTQTSTSLGTQIMPTAGRHNIGIRAGVNGGVWVDGTQLGLPGLILTNSLPVNAGFGTHGIGADLTNGLVLLENLNYIRSYNRADEKQQAPTLGTPRVTVTNFDGPRPVTVWEPISDDLGIQTLKAVNYTEDATRADHNHGGVDETQLYLVNGRRITALVVTPTSDQATYSDGIRTVLDDPVPGVKWANQVDAVGCITPLSRQDLLGPVNPWFNADTATFVGEGIYAVANQTVYLGAGQPEGSSPTTYMSGATDSAEAPVCEDLGAGLARETINCSNGDCLIRGSNASMPKTVATIGTVTGTAEDWNNGGGFDPKHGIMLSGGYLSGPGGSGIQPLGAAAVEMSDTTEQVDDPGSLQDEINNGLALRIVIESRLLRIARMNARTGTFWRVYRTPSGGYFVRQRARACQLPVDPGVNAVAPGGSGDDWAYTEGEYEDIDLIVPNTLAGPTDQELLDAYLTALHQNLKHRSPAHSQTASPAVPKTALADLKASRADLVRQRDEIEIDRAGGASGRRQLADKIADLDAQIDALMNPKTAGDAGGGKPPKPPVNTAAPTPFGEDHHIGTNKGHWKTRFKALFKTANMTLEDEDNKVWLEDHCGRHTEWYHNYVYRRLERAIGTRTGAEAEAALRAELRLIREQLLANPRLPYSHGD